LVRAISRVTTQVAVETTHTKRTYQNRDVGPLCRIIGAAIEAILACGFLTWVMVAQSRASVTVLLLYQIFGDGINMYMFAQDSTKSILLMHIAVRTFCVGASVYALAKWEKAGERVEKADAAKIVIICPNCSQQIRVPVGKGGTIRCPRPTCGHSFWAQT
jgi:predicted transporter